MVIMAIDHSRDFFSGALFQPTDLTQTNYVYFFTRWITHFCAPAFVFLAGTGAGLSRTGGRPVGSLSRFLWTRGVWLIIAEVTVFRFAWAFNVTYTLQAVWAQVIWAIGWSMLGLSLLVYLPTWAIAAFGIVMMAGHNLLDGIPLHTQQPMLYGADLHDWLWSFLHVQRLPLFYPVIPWVGVMAAGYAFAWILRKPNPDRDRTLLRLGGALTLGFVVLRFLNVYGDPAPWSVQPRDGMTFLSFLNTTKYPPSLLYLLMTLGPCILLLVPFERLRGPVATVLDTFGRVPFFYYFMHVFVLHLLALVAALATGFNAGALFAPPFFGYGQGWGFGLPMVYAMWLVTVVVLYPLCRWFAGVKSRRRDLWWLGYL
jgi:uncharacterized membrane protein